MPRPRMLTTALVLVLALLAVMRPIPASGETPRIGVLANVRGPAWKAFEEGLREHGYVDGKTITIEWRLAEGRFERLLELAADLVRADVKVILAPAPPYVRAARAATSSIPIVFALVSDPVAEGFVASLARPGGNVTGLSSVTVDLVPKRLELLAEMIPGLSRVAVLTDWDPSPGDWKTELQSAARQFDVELKFQHVAGPDALDAAFLAIAEQRPQAAMVLVGVHLYAHRRRIAKLALKHRLPTALNLREYAEAGGLMVYAASTYDLMRRSAGYVDRILKGATPAELPVAQPTVFELIINMKTARVLGLTIPPSLLLRADDVIE